MMHASAPRDGIPIVLGRTLLMQPEQRRNHQHGGSEDGEYWQDAPASLRAVFAASVVVVLLGLAHANLAKWARVAIFTDRVALGAADTSLVAERVAPVRLCRECGEAPIAWAQNQACDCGVGAAERTRDVITRFALRHGRVSIRAAVRWRANSALIRAAQRACGSFANTTRGSPHFRLVFAFAAGKTCDAPLVRLRVADRARAAWSVAGGVLVTSNGATAALGVHVILGWFKAAFAAATVVRQWHTTITTRSQTSRPGSFHATEL
mmetsp:Transcript_64843/g.177806  ORF Transcript_64843/g.177806 Transcript_64843/m.177806 type:complete len:265 (+) Transcript_64843:3114-3908(+)